MNDRPLEQWAIEGKGKVGWFTRLMHRWTGIDAVAYWRKRHEATQDLLGQLIEETRKQNAEAERVIRMQTDEVEKAHGQAVEARGQLIVERNARQLLYNLVSELGQQAAKNANVAPTTMLHVIDVTTKEAIDMVDKMIATGEADVAEIVNIRATIANRLLPDPVQPTKDRAGNKPVMKTERKRDGRAGDTSEAPDPKRPHLYEYDPYAAMNSLNHEGLLCNVIGCGKKMADAIHINSDIGWAIPKPEGIRMTAEKRPEDGPPQTLDVPASHVFDSMLEAPALCAHQWPVRSAGQTFWRVCARKKDDPVHIVTLG